MNEPRKPHSSFLYSLKAVIWSFTGLRRKSDFDTDSARLNPVHIVIAGLLAFITIGVFMAAGQFASGFLFADHGPLGYLLMTVASAVAVGLSLLLMRVWNGAVLDLRS